MPRNLQLSLARKTACARQRGWFTLSKQESFGGLWWHQNDTTQLTKLIAKACKDSVHSVVSQTLGLQRDTIIVALHNGSEQVVTQKEPVVQNFYRNWHLLLWQDPTILLMQKLLLCYS